MAEQSTTGSALYNVGTGVIGDFSVEARKNAMDRIKAEGVERRRKQQETEKKSELAFERLKELKTGGPRAYGDYLQQKRDGISNWLTEGFQKSDGNFFSGPEGRKNRVEFNNKIADFNNSVAYTTQTQADLEKQQELLAQNPDSYTEESVRANENYMSLNLEDQLRTEVPKLQLKVDPVDWEQNLVYSLPNNMFNERDPSSSGSNRWKLNEEKLNTYVDNAVSVAFSGVEGAGTPSTEGFGKQMKIRFDEDPLSRTLDRVTVVDDSTGDTAYTLALKKYAKDKLSETIKLTQSTGKISAATPKKVTEEETGVAPTRGVGGVQTIGGPLERKTGEFIPTPSDTEVSYTEEGNIEFDSGDKAYRSLAAPIVINVSNGKVSKPSGNITLPKEGGVVQYGYTVSDLSKPIQKALKNAGYNESTVDMLRITKIEKETIDKEGKITGGGETTTLIPIIKGVDNSLSKASQGYNALKKTPAEGEFD